MALNVRHPIWLPAAPKPGINVFALLFFIETFARASLATVIPVQAYDLIRNEQQISFVYTLVGLAALAFTLVLPGLIRRLSRRWVYTAGALCIVLASACLVTFTVPGQIAGMVARVIGTACLNVTLSLYILDNIRKQDFVRNDSVRIGYSTIGWTAAPYLGVWLYVHYGPEATYSASSGFALLLVAVFWYLRLSDGKAIRRTSQLPANPLRNIGRFIRQPRLRLAWLIAFGRSSFWSTFFVYAPILMVTTGQGKEAGGLLVSAGNALLITLLVWGRIGERYGVRRLAAFSFAAAAGCLLIAGWTGAQQPIATAALLLLAALFTTPLDAVGGVPFYRAVHPYERAEMTSVYRTYLDFGELLPPLVYGVLLGFFGFGVVFAALACLMGGCGLAAWVHLNRRL